MTVRKLVKIHFSLVLFVLTNFAVVQLSGIGINSNLIFLAKVVFYLLAIVLFFLTYKKWRRLSIYFSLYILYPLLTIILWALDGILGAILASIFLAAFSFPNEQFKDGVYTFHKNFTGFMAPCCDSYDILQRKYLLLQKKVGEVHFNKEYSFDKSSFVVRDKKGYLKLGVEVYDTLNKLQKIDTTLEIEIH